MLEAIEARLVDQSQQFCSNAALTEVPRHLLPLLRGRLEQLFKTAFCCQAVQSVVPPRPPRKIGRAWAHPGTENGGVIGGAAAAVVDDALEQSPKVCFANVCVRCRRLSHVRAQQKRRSR